MPAQSEIRTERLILRAPVLDDAPDIARLANNEKIHAVTARLPFPYSEADAVHFIVNIAADATEGARIMALKQSGTLIGTIRLSHKPGEQPDLGYWVGEPFWGKGYATEAVRGLLAASASIAPVVIAKAISTNHASRAVLEKCGFALIGEAVDNCGPHKGVTIAQYRYEARNARTA